MNELIDAEGRKKFIDELKIQLGNVMSMITLLANDTGEPIDNVLVMKILGCKGKSDAPIPTCGFEVMFTSDQERKDKNTFAYAILINRIDKFDKNGEINITDRFLINHSGELGVTKENVESVENVLAEACEYVHDSLIQADCKGVITSTALDT